MNGWGAVFRSPPTREVGLKVYKMQKVLVQPNPASLEINAVISFLCRRQGQRSLQGEILSSEEISYSHI